jgi:hypothetical protein
MNDSEGLELPRLSHINYGTFLMVCLSTVF